MCVSLTDESKMEETKEVTTTVNNVVNQIFRSAIVLLEHESNKAIRRAAFLVGPDKWPQQYTELVGDRNQGCCH